MQRIQANPFENVQEQYENLQAQEDLAVATVAGGCFWCMEGPFEAMEGVEEVITGYAGGTSKRPTYEAVASGQTDYREAAQIFYDPQVVSFGELLETYWQQIDPADPGGQFADRGEQYTTAIFYHDEKQQEEAEVQIETLSKMGRYDKPIVTEVLAFSTFYPAEEYHQDFYKKSAEYYKRYAKGSGRADYVEAAKKWWEENRE